MALLKAKRYPEAVKAIEADEALRARALSDAEAMNAYGIACYFTALDGKDESLENQALELLQRAAALGSDAASRNLEGAAVYGPARKEWEAWKEVMNEE